MDFYVPTRKVRDSNLKSNFLKVNMKKVDIQSVLDKDQFSQIIKIFRKDV